jgi:hypothetical protein
MGNVVFAPKLEKHKTWILTPHGSSIWLYQYLGDGDKKIGIPKEDTICVGKFARR